MRQYHKSSAGIVLALMFSSDSR